MFSAATLPLIIWQHLKILWTNYQKAAVSHRSVNLSEHFFQERCPSLAQQYFFVLAVLIGQCNLHSHFAPFSSLVYQTCTPISLIV